MYSIHDSSSFHVKRLEPYQKLQAASAKSARNEADRCNMASNYRPSDPAWSHHNSAGDSYRPATNFDRNIAYQDLSFKNGEIRLIFITPNENPSSPIECGLKKLPLEEAEKYRYVALSYFWGGSDSTKVAMTISGKHNRVPIALAHALQELRHRGYHTVWADQLCINQSNLEEVAYQVDRMGDIYRYAYHTMAWLGFCKPEERALFERARSLMRSLHSWREGKRNTPQPQPKGKKSKKQSKATPPPPPPLASKSDRIALSTVLERDYWNRAWIIQEVAVSHSVHFFWNGQFFPIWELQKAIATCKALASTSKEAESLTFSTQFQHVDRLLRFRQFRETPIRLIDALILSQDAECSKPRDRLYALKHLAVDGRDIVPFPNYEEAIDVVNRKTAWRLIRHYADGDMIVLPRHFTNTWAPQWHSPTTWVDKRINDYLTGESRFVAERSDRNGGSRTIIKKWTATKDSRTYWTLLRSTNHLQVRSKRIGRITQCSATDSEANDSGAWGELVRVRKYGSRRVERLISLCWLLYDLLPNNEYKKAAKVKIGDVHYLLGRPLIREYVRDNVPRFYRWLFCRQNLEFRIDDVPLANWLCAFSKKPRDDTKARAMRCYNSVNMGMRLFTTDQNNLGWATSSCQPGDELFLIQGCSMPVVLRKGPGEGLYHLIGDSIVHGLMEGQGVGDGHFSSWPLVTLV